MSLGPLLSDNGRTAQIYAWGDDQVLKLYHTGWGLDAVEREAARSRVAQHSGFRVPAVGEIVEVDGRHGLVFERIEGQPMGDVFFKRPWQARRLARQLAELHADMHARQVEGLPNLHEVMLWKIERASRLPESMRAEVLAHLSTLPSGSALCHGDFHPWNILLTSDGPVIIDWVDAVSGPPLADVARTYVLLIATAESHRQPLYVRVLFKLILLPALRTYLAHYLALTGADEALFKAWQVPVAAARLREDIAGEERLLLRMIEAGLAR